MGGIIRLNSQPVLARLAETRLCSYQEPTVPHGEIIPTGDHVFDRWQHRWSLFAVAEPN